MPFHVVETSDREGKKDVFLVSSIWIEEDILFWPPKMLIRNKPQKNLYNCKPDENWHEILTFKILQSDIESLEKANARLKFYERYTNTDSELEERKLSALKRKHPISYTETHLDFSSEFERLQQKSKSTKPLSCTDVPQVPSSNGKHSLSLSPSYNGGTTSSSRIKVHHVSENGWTAETVEIDPNSNKNSVKDFQRSQKDIITNRRHETIKQDNLPNKIKLEELAPITSELNSLKVNRAQLYSAASHMPPNIVASICEISLSSVIENSGVEGSSLTNMYESSNESDTTSNEKNMRKTSHALKRIKLHRIEEPVNVPDHSAGGSSKSKKKVEQSIRKEVQGKHPASRSESSSSSSKLDVRYSSSDSKYTDFTDIEKSSSDDELFINNKICSEDPDYTQVEDIDRIEEQINVSNQHLDKSTKTEYGLKTSTKNDVQELSNYSRSPPTASSRKAHSNEQSANFHGHPSVGKPSKSKSNVESATRKQVAKNTASRSGTSSSPSKAIVAYSSSHSKYATFADIDKSSSEDESFIDNELSNATPERLRGNIVKRMEEQVEVRSRFHAKSSVNQISDERSSKKKAQEVSNHSRGRAAFNDKSDSEFFFEEQLQASKGRTGRDENVPELSYHSLLPQSRDSNTSASKSNSENSSDEEQQSTSTKRIVGQKKGAREVPLSTIRRDRRAIKNQTKMIKTILSQQNDFGNRLAAMEHGLKTLSEMFSSYVVRQNKKPKMSLVPLDPSFIMPRPKLTKIKEVLTLNRNCLDGSYIDQMVVRLKRLVSTKEKTFNKSVKDVMEHLFSYELICHYSWTGKQELNSDATPKQKFECLHGVIDLITKICSFHLIYTKSIGQDVKKSIKNFIRRAKQNMLRQNQE